MVFVEGTGGFWQSKLDSYMCFGTIASLYRINFGDHDSELTGLSPSKEESLRPSNFPGSVKDAVSAGSC